MKTRIAFIVVVPDNIDILVMPNQIKSLKLKSKVLGISDMDYVGVVYEGRAPGKAELKDLLNAAGVTLDD